MAHDTMLLDEDGSILRAIGESAEESSSLWTIVGEKRGAARDGSGLGTWVLPEQGQLEAIT